MALKKALLKDNLLLEDMQAAPEDEGLHVWWLGQSGFLVRSGGTSVLFDPYLSDSLTKKYESTDKPHIRITERVVDPGLLTGIDVITSSHNHTDHLDAETLLPLFAANPEAAFVLPRANMSFAQERLGAGSANWVDLNSGESVSCHGCTLHGISAAHNELDQDDNGYHRYMGFVAELNGWTIYHSGDTLWFDTLEAELADFDIDLALLPINGNKPERRVSGNLDSLEAAQLGLATGSDLVIPCHYDMFTFNTADPADFADACVSTGQPGRVLQHGERLTIYRGEKSD